MSANGNLRDLCSFRNLLGKWDYFVTFCLCFVFSKQKKNLRFKCPCNYFIKKFLHILPRVMYTTCSTYRIELMYNGTWFNHNSHFFLLSPMVYIVVATYPISDDCLWPQRPHICIHFSLVCVWVYIQNEWKKNSIAKKITALNGRKIKIYRKQVNS